MNKHILDHIDPKILGARLQAARKARGMTQQAVTDEMEMARTTLVAIEKGERRVIPYELIQLAGIYGRPVSDFVTIGFVSQFRTEWREDLDVDEGLDKAVDELEQLAEDYVELERMCGLPMTKAYPSAYETSVLTPEQAAEEIAAAERNRLGIGDGHISNLRDRIETDVGLRIFYFAMPPKISGVFAYNEVLGGCMGLNSNHPQDRRNWSLAHEYGHFLTNRYRAEITFLSERQRQSASERLADAFAENFLMPASGINRRFTELHRSNPSGQITLAQLCPLADLYQVSVQALIIRLEKLQRLPSGTWVGLEQEGFKSRRAQQLLELNAGATEESLLPRRYLNLAVLAYEKELLSEGHLTKFLRSDWNSARVLLEEMSWRFNAESEEGGYDSFELDLTQTVPGR